jgi:hypothetical protein
MTNNLAGTSALALGAAAFVSFFSLQAVRADTSTPQPQSDASPSLSEPAPTPDWAEGGPAPTDNGAALVHRPSLHRHTASRSGHRVVHSSDNPLASAATGVVGGVADLGSVAVYPLYCFPNYGSCRLRLLYRP